VRFSGIAIVLAALCASIAVSFAQEPPQLPADSLQLNGSHASVWYEEKTSVVELSGPVHIDLDHTRLTADNAVIWISPSPNGLLTEQRVEIALMGNAELRQGEIVRTERNLWITAVVTGSIRLNSPRTTRDDHTSPLYTQALTLRQDQTSVAANTIPQPAPVPERRWSEFPTAYPRAPAKPPAPAAPPKQVFEFNDEHLQHMTTSDGHIAIVLTGGVTCRYRGVKKDLLEFVAQDAVLFTDLTTLVGVNKGPGQKHQLADHILAGYFEGDVQVYVTPADTAKPDLRLQAQRVYYEFRTDRAVLTDVVFHTVDLQKQIPIFIRADLMHQLSQGEFTAQHVELTTSSFANPSYSMAASQAYVRAENTGNPETGDRVTFTADNALFKIFGLPVFYLPVAGGTMTARGGPLRAVSTTDDGVFGYGVRTQWGLFETLGQTAPKDLDASYRLDEFGNRGFAAGLDSIYSGGFVSETTRDPFNFLGDLHGYFINDRGYDNLGGARGLNKDPDDLRARAYMEHQVFFPDDWQAQLRFGYVTDPNFLTQWFPDEYNQNLPINESMYLKHQKDTEVFTLLAEDQPNGFITTAESVQEQREINRLPEAGYHRIGDSFADDRLTFFSDNTASALQFSYNGSTLAQQGLSTRNVVQPGVLNPGIPAYGYTGTPNDATYRGDFRQEIDWPKTFGPIKVVPFVFGRYTVYSQGVDSYPQPVSPVILLPDGRPFTPSGKTIPTTVITSGDQNRLMAGAGIKFTTSFWKVDDSAESALFDIHRLRHVIEPEIDLLTSAQTVDQNRLLIYDPGVDAVNDIQAAEISLFQRWQTKRGGPGRWRSVDVFSFNLHLNLFANQPDRRFLDPTDFRGLYFSSLPEASVPRNSLNADALWRISDSTAVLADCSENLDRERFATASIGLAVQRDERLSYFIGNRYIADLNSNITTFDATYELSRSYDMSFSESFDFGQSRNVYYSATLTRKFDRFEAGFRVYYDQTTNQNGFSFEFSPYGFAKSLGTDQAQQFSQQPL
jgi:hypothetical protein